MTEVLADLISQRVKFTGVSFTDEIFPEKSGPLANMLANIAGLITYNDAVTEPV